MSISFDEILDQLATATGAQTTIDYEELTCAYLFLYGHAPVPDSPLILELAAEFQGTH